MARRSSATPAGWTLRHSLETHRLALRQRPDTGMAEDEEPEFSAAVTSRPLFALVLVVVVNVSTPLTVTAAVTFALLAQCFSVLASAA